MNKNPKTAHLLDMRNLSAEERSEMAAKGSKAAKENIEKRKTFKELFAANITPKKAEKMVNAFIDMVLDKEVGVKDRRAAFELILKVMGEYDNLSSNEIKQLNSVIRLKID